MSTTSELQWGRLRVVTEKLDPTSRRTQQVEPYAQLVGYTRTGQAREIPLTERELTELVADAAGALVQIQNLRRSRAAAAAQAERRAQGEDRHR